MLTGKLVNGVLVWIILCLHCLVLAEIRYTIQALPEMGPWPSVWYGMNDQCQIVMLNKIWYEGSITIHNDLSSASDINNTGTILCYDYSKRQPFIWKDGVSTMLSMEGYPICLNDVGQYAGAVSNNAVIWHAGQNMPIKLWENGQAIGMNNTGQVVGIQGTNPVLWDNGQLILLGSGDAMNSFAYGINEKKQIVGGTFYSTEYGQYAWIWEDGVLTNLNDLIDPNSQWHLEEAGAINNKGQIFGYGTNPQGESCAYLLTPTNDHPIYGGGNGTADDPYQIWTPEQMNTIGLNPDDWSKHFKLMNNIDMSAYTGIQYNIIGNEKTPFSGIFDGDGHIINNLAYTTIEDIAYIGMFGRTVNATIKNLGIENILISSNGINIGGLVGYNMGIITSCYVTGTVSGSSSIGGLTGSNNGTITSCYAMDSVSGTGEYSTVGGLVGRNYGTINACYATSSVSGNFTVGGLVGRSGIVTACFWDVQKSGQAGSGGGKGLTTAQMKTMSIYQNAGWAGKGWKLNDGTDYPRLNWENTGGVPIPSPQAIPLIGDGTIENPYLIFTAQEFALLSWYSEVLNKNIRLAENLDLQEVGIYPIGDLGSFSGTFDGNNHIISNAIINQPTSDYVGLFNYVVQDGQIRNLGVENVNITGRGPVGGLVGDNGGGTITSCYVTGSVSGSSIVGGLVGWTYNSIITSCYADGVMTGDYEIGGLAGWTIDSTITNCYANGSVSGSSIVGGLSGVNSGMICSCYATGIVIGTGDSVGGLVGDNSDTITFCFWDTKTSGRSNGVGYGSSNGVTGITTAQMQTHSTFTDAGWDFTNETTNGINDIWRMCIDGVDYPRLNLESIEGDFTCPDGVNTEDLNSYVDHWLMNNCMVDNDYCGGADLNFSGVVDLTDWMIFAENWLLEI